MSNTISNAEGTQTKGRVRIVRLVAAAVVVTAVVGVAVAVPFFGPSRDAEPKVTLSGRVEGDDAIVAPKVGGRIREITVREGDQVKTGQVIAVLDDEQLRAREDEARFAVTQAEARVLSAQHEIMVLQAELRQSQLGTGQARADADGRVAQAEAQEAEAEADLARVEAIARQARADEERLTKLADSGVISTRDAEQARSNAVAEEAAVRAARKKVDSARAAVAATRAALTNPEIREAAALGVERQIVQARADVDAAMADVARAQARLKESEANRSDLRVVAPFDGTVITRAAEPGEVVTAGTPIVTVVNLSAVYLRGFVPEGEIGNVRVGQAARVFLDSAPETPIEAVVDRVDPEATFTPENTYFRDDRVKQVVGVKLRILGAEGYAKPGMPAEGEILIDSQIAGR